MNKLIKFTSLCLTLGLSACLPSNSSNSGGGSCNSDINGTFKTDCYQQSMGVYVIDTLQVSGSNAFSYSSQAYSDSNCVTTAGGAQTTTGTVSVGGASSAVSGATEIDVSPTGGLNEVGCGAGQPMYTIYQFTSACKLAMGEAVGAATGCGSAANRHNNVASTNNFTRQ